MYAIKIECLLNDVP